MFDPDFYPTPENVIQLMLEGHNVEGKTILEPSAGKGNIIDFLKSMNVKDVICCENNKDLALIAGSKCRLLTNDFFTVTSDQISHIDYIIMNPPFSNADKHILHAWDIAPAGCKIISLCNSDTIKNNYTENRKKIIQLISENGSSKDLGECFNNSERKTYVNVSVINIQKPGESYNTEFEGFFTEEEPEDEGIQGLLPYNVVRDLVQRYIGAVKIFDDQLKLAVQMNELTSDYYTSGMGLSISKNKVPIERNTFKKEMQKAGWKFIFNKMDLNKYSTQGLREDINKFVETQSNIPFTMKNVYKMLEIVVGTAGQRMDKALLEVFEKVINRADENKYYGPTNRWKTNSYYLLNEKFILPYVTEVSFRGRMDVKYNSYANIVDDMIKALCFLTGTNYDELTYKTVNDFCRRMNPEFGQWYSMGFFEIRGYKKGTMHFKFQDQNLWAQFNQRIAKIKGYPLYEHKKEEPKPAKSNPVKANTKEPEILFSITIK